MNTELIKRALESEQDAAQKDLLNLMYQSVREVGSRRTSSEGDEDRAYAAIAALKQRLDRIKEVRQALSEL